MSDLGKAYVQIIPSAEGITGKIKSALGNAPSEAGSSGGLAMGKNLVSALKGVIAAAGIGKVLKDSIMEGAKLEQSLGGIDTLFKESNEKVVANAKNAFKTVGMSANEYMENVTGFSASLLQALGDDTEIAADMADMAMIDMSDNANKMGTSMESITNAYQGFAKQNYTMLDNLKLGYGGTKAEMERLLRDAEELEGYELGSFDVSNFAHIVKAINIVQRNLEITGTTALEAEGTISGSFNSMKASALDLMAALTLGSDSKIAISEAMANLVQTTVTFLFNNLLPAVVNVIKLLPGAIAEGVYASYDQLRSSGFDIVSFIDTAMTEYIPNMIDTIRTALLGIIDKISENLPNILDRGKEIMISLITGILNNIPAVIETMATVTKKLFETIVKNYPKYMQNGSEILLALINGIINNLPKVIVTVLRIMTEMVKTFHDHFPQILQTGITIAGKLLAGLLRATPNILRGILSIVGQMIKSFFSVDWSSIGINIIRGVIRGVLSAGSELINTVVNLAVNAFNGAKSWLGIHSPSRKFKWLADMSVAGFVGGMEDGQKDIYDAVVDASETATDGFNADLQGAVGYTQSATKNGSDNSSNSTINGGVNITVYGAQGQDVEDLAEEIEKKIKQNMDDKEMVFA